MTPSRIEAPGTADAADPAGSVPGGARAVDRPRHGLCWSRSDMMRRLPPLLTALALLAAGCGDEPAADITTQAPSSMATAATTTTQSPTTTGMPATTTTSLPAVIPAPVGRLEGTIGGWPDDAVDCSARLQAWGPYPYRETEVACGADATRPLPFVFEVLPAGDWGIRVWVSWTDGQGMEHARLNEFPVPSEPPEWITVAEGATTTVDLVADRPGGRIAGTVIDTRMALPIGGQFEPGASMIGLLAYGEDGSLAGVAGNACDGSYAVWLPEGRHALAAVDWSSDPAVWQSEWAPGGQSFEVAAGSDFWVAVDPAVIPADAWVSVVDGASADLSVSLEPGPGWAEPTDDGWFPWWVPPVVGEPLPEGHPWRDPSWWVGRRVTWEDDPTGVWPPRVLVDGEPLDLGGWARESLRWAGDNLIVAAPYPPEPQSPSNRATFLAGYRMVLAADTAGVVTDALYLETEPFDYVTAEGLAPHIPGVAFVVLGVRQKACGIFEGPAARAWRVVDGALVEADPTGVSVIPAG